MLDWIGRGGEALDLAAAGHRIVHGGEAFADPIVVTPDVVRHCRISMRVDKFDISLANRFCSRARAAVDADDGPRAGSSGDPRRVQRPAFPAGSCE